MFCIIRQLRFIEEHHLNCPKTKGKNFELSFFLCIFALAMMTKADIKLIRSLEMKKYRLQEGLFVAEGRKVIEELQGGFEMERLWDDPEEVRKASLLQHPQGQLALFRLPEPESTSTDIRQLVLALDGVQDPGNVGTIMRTADWYGVRDVYCSHQTADCFSPKVVQATMGSLARVRMHYVDLPEWLRQLPQEVPVYGTLLDGESIYEKRLQEQCVLVMGNEGRGLTPEVRELVTERLLIPRVGTEGPESLNVAIATAVVLAQMRVNVKC